MNGCATRIAQVWLAYIEREANRIVGAGGLRAALLKLALDQGVYTPCYQVCFFMVLAVVEGQPVHEGWRRALKTLPKALPASWAFWIPAQLVNFLTVPPHWRVIFVNVASLAGVRSTGT